MPADRRHPTRRELLGRGLNLVGALPAWPLLMGRAGEALAGPSGPTCSGGARRVLVIVRLSGGNDGLNTVIPYEAEAYYRARPRLALRRSEVLPLANGLGLHPAAAGLKNLYDRGLLAVVQGVGYPQMSRSHFGSAVMWLSAMPNAPVDMGSQAGELRSQLQTVARRITADPATWVYHVCLGGFDTHTDQAARHARLLRQLGDALQEFVDALAEGGMLERVLIMTVSEFGRRVRENRYGGTDHGTAAPMFLVGARLRAGVHGEHPSLDELERGGLAPRVDFRRVYATVLQDWLRLSSGEIVGPGFAPLNLIWA
jgi:uncharacterized protein (DUF1501 family)